VQPLIFKLRICALTACPACLPACLPGWLIFPPAGVLVLEELEHAKARGVPILAEFVGGDFTCDAHHMTEPEPNGRGVILCIERALAKAGVAPEEVRDGSGQAPAERTLACCAACHWLL
jgi:hypothetical protein